MELFKKNDPLSLVGAGQKYEDRTGGYGVPQGAFVLLESLLCWPRLDPINDVYEEKQKQINKWG